MTEKTFLITLDDVKVCPHCSYARCNVKLIRLGSPRCNGELRDRPEYCPLVEHDIGMCHIKYKELSNGEEKDLESVATEAAKRIWPEELRSKVLLGLDEYDF